MTGFMPELSQPSHVTTFFFFVKHNLIKYEFCKFEKCRGKETYRYDTLWIVNTRTAEGRQQIGDKKREPAGDKHAHYDTQCPSERKTTKKKSSSRNGSSFVFHMQCCVVNTIPCVLRYDSITLTSIIKTSVFATHSTVRNRRRRIGEFLITTRR